MTEVSHIQDLPTEIRCLIYSYISQQDLIHKIRLVCKQWKDEVDNLCDLEIDLDDRKLGWERILELRIKSLKILHFLHPPPQGTGTRILKHVNLLKCLKMTEMISPSNFYYILCDCAPSLIKLQVTLSMTLIGFNFPTSFKLLNLEKLKKFSIKVTTLPGTTRGVLDNDNNLMPISFLGSIQSKNMEDYFSQFLGNSMKNLKSLNIQIRCLSYHQVSFFTQLTLTFISTHWRQLKSVNFDLILGHGLPSSEFRPLTDEDLAKIDFKLLEKCTTLNSLRIVTSSPAGVNLWLDLLERQRKLIFLEVDILPAPTSLFREVIRLNCTTLVYVEITDLTIWDEEGNCVPFDMTCFEICVNLKKLILDRNVTRKRLFDTAELINLFNLPVSLRELALNYFNVLSDELIIMMNGVGENLMTLYLTQCGNGGFFGVDGTTLEKIIRLPNISFIEISPLNFSDPEERDKLNIILETFGYHQNHSYFQLAKMTHRIPIQFHALVIQSDDEDSSGEEEDE